MYVYLVLSTEQAVIGLKWSQKVNRLSISWSLRPLITTHIVHQALGPNPRKVQYSQSTTNPLCFFLFSIVILASYNFWNPPILIEAFVTVSIFLALTDIFIMVQGTCWQNVCFLKVIFHQYGLLLKRLYAQCYPPPLQALTYHCLTHITVQYTQ